MKKPLWKKLLSHIFEFHIESAPSDINPHLYVSLIKGRYQLSTANAIYSYEDLYDNYFKAFQQIDLQQFGNKKVLILGLGLASIPLILEKLSPAKFYFTAVELDASVIYLAGKYALPSLRSPIEMIEADAADFVKMSAQKYDLIAVDLFLDDIIPETFQQSQFLKAVRAMLNPNGLVMYNRLALTASDREASEAFFKGTFSHCFRQAHLLSVGSNFMLLNTGEHLLPQH